MNRFLALALLVVAACRGATSEDPPLYVFPDMDWQPKIQGQEEFPTDMHGLGKPFWADARGNRKPVDGTVARGHLNEDEAYFQGRVGDQFVAKVPLEVDAATINRGEERYNIYCSPCHDRTGSGKGMIIQRAGGSLPPPPELFGERVRSMSDGEIFSTITHGIRNMPSYAYQIPVEDRWAIVTWVRVLQRSQWGNASDVPADKQGTIEAAQ